MDDKQADENISETPATDVADRLCKIINRIRDTAESLEFRYPHAHSQPVNGLGCPLHLVFEPVAIKLGFQDYVQLHENFVLLCNRVIRDVQSLVLKRPETQARWVNAAQTAKHVFNANNFVVDCNTVFANHFSADVMHRLEDASDRLQDRGVKEATKPQLREALDAARNALNAYEEYGELPQSLAKILKHYIHQIEMAFQRYNDFGEEAFWSTYKELFATFLQTHDVLMQGKEDENVKSAIRTMAKKMSYGLPALSITSDIATIAATGLAAYQLIAG